MVPLLLVTVTINTVHSGYVTTEKYTEMESLKTWRLERVRRSGGCAWPLLLESV